MSGRQAPFAKPGPRPKLLFDPPNA